MWAKCAQRRAPSLDDGSAAMEHTHLDHKSTPTRARTSRGGFMHVMFSGLDTKIRLLSTYSLIIGYVTIKERFLFLLHTLRTLTSQGRCTAFISVESRERVDSF